jgi:hypothetical protein
MAIRLQREHSLPVVAARLVQDASGPAVQLDRIVNQDGEPSLQGSETLSLQDYGGRTTTRSDPDLRVPDAMVQYVASWAGEVLEPDRALWLHLVKPYGLLGSIPWERDLVPALHRPLLRLPDVLPEPSRSSSSLTVALIATAPAPEGPPPALELGLPVARALAAAVSGGLAGRLHLHVFADTDARQAVEDGMRQLGLAEVEVHAPGTRPPDGRSYLRSDRSRVGDLRSGWLRWVRDTLTGRPVDAVHFLVHGNSLGTRGAILTPLDATAEREIPVSVEAAEIEMLLTQIGASTAGFSRLPNNWSDHGLRQVVDELGSRRAGPVLLHDPALDGDHAALTEAYRFLTEAQPSVPPASASLTMYAQPRQVLQEVPHLRPADGWTVGPSSAVQAQFDKEETPGWLAAAQRYLEQQELTLMRFRSESQSRTPSPAEQSHYAGVESALRKARDVIDRHAERLL